MGWVQGVVFSSPPKSKGELDRIELHCIAKGTGGLRNVTTEHKRYTLLKSLAR